MIFGGDGIADEQFAEAFTDVSIMDEMTVTRPASGADSSLSMLFDQFYGAAAAAAGYEGGIYTREVFDAVAIIGLAQATALRTPIDDGVKDMLGTAIASPSSPQLGAAGVHAFDPNGDVAGNGFDVCTFHLHDHDGETHVDLECHSSWGLFEGLVDNGIPMVADDDECPFDDEDWCAEAEETCASDDANDSACGSMVAEYCAREGNEDEECAVIVEECATTDDEEADDFCAAFESYVAEEEVEETTEEETTEEETDTNMTVEDVEEAADEVPGFGLISAVAAIGAVLLLRRRL